MPSAIILTQDHGSPRWVIRAMLAVVLVAGVLTFWDLGQGGLRNGDEARYALVAENILLTGEPVTLTYAETPYFQKAPARFWLSALAYRVGGVNEWTVRFYSAFAGVGAVWLIMLVGRRLSGPLAGIISGVALATMPGFLHVHGARTGEMDSGLVFFWILAVFYLLRRGNPGRGFLLFCLSAAMAGMVKHLVFTPVILAFGCGYYLLSGHWRQLGVASVTVGLAAVVAVVAPWHLAQWQIHGNIFWQVYFGRVVVETALSPVDTHETRFFYLGVLLSGTWPWLCAMPLHLANRLRCRWRAPEFWLPLFWLAFTLLLVTLAQRKLAWYALPAYPAVALMVGRLAGRILPAAEDVRPVWHLAAPLLGVAALVLAHGANSDLFAATAAYKVTMDGNFVGNRVVWSLVPVLFLVGAALVFNRRQLGAVAWLNGGRRLLAVTLILLVGYGLYNTWLPRQQAVTSPWRDLLAQAENRLDAEAPLLVMLPEPPRRDDVRLYYLRRLPGQKITVDEAWAARQLVNPVFSGTVLLARRDLVLLSRLVPDLGQAEVAWIVAGNEHLVILRNPAASGV